MKVLITFIVFVLIICLLPTFAFADNYIDENYIVDLNKEFDYNILTKNLIQLEEEYTDLIDYESLGKTYDGRDIWLIKLGKGKIKIFLEGGNHGREYASTPILMKTIEDYSSSYYSNEKINNYNIKSILEKVTFYIVPMSNPDGVKLARKGISEIKDRNLKKELLKIIRNFAVWKSNARGVDLNRNFPCKTWGNFKNGISSNFSNKPSSSFFKGYSSNSELEAQAIVDVLHKNNIISVLSYHSRGEVIYWWKPFLSKEYNRVQEIIANKLSVESGYKLIPMGYEKKKDGTDGSLSDHIADYYKKPVLTLETLPGNTTFPIDISLISRVYNQVKGCPLALAEESIYLYDSDYYEYKVYQFNRLLHDFNNYDDALDYAVKWDHSAIIKKNELVYHNYENSEDKDILHLIFNTLQ